MNEFHTSLAEAYYRLPAQRWPNPEEPTDMGWHRTVAAERRRQRRGRRRQSPFRAVDG